MGSDTVDQPCLLLLLLLLLFLLLPLLILDFRPLTVVTVQRLADSSAWSLQDALGVTARGLMSWTDRRAHTATLQGRRGFEQRRGINSAMTPRPSQRRCLTYLSAP